MPELRNGTKHCECTGCGEFFNSVSGFDQHRVFVVPGSDDFNNRRCLTPGEMLAKGWLKNAGGWWITGSKPTDVQHAR